MKKNKKRTRENPKLKKLVTKFKAKHDNCCKNFAQATYRLVKEQAEVGDVLFEMKQEGGFKTKRRLWTWLELEVGDEIPRSTFYRYLNASEWWKQAEIVHGQDALTDVCSLKALKILASPKVEFEPIDEGWRKKGDTYTRTIQGVECEIIHPEGKKPTMNTNGRPYGLAGSLREACSIMADRAAAMAKLAAADHERPADLPHKPFDSPVTIKLNPDQADDAPMPTAEEGGDDSDPNDEDEEELKPTEPTQEPTKKPQKGPKPPEGKQVTYFHHACHNFQIDGDSLQCLDQQGQTVILVAPTKQHMSDMLGDVLNDGLAVYAKAKLFDALKTPKGDKTASQIAEDFGLTQADIRRHLRLLRLTAEEQQQVAIGKLTVDEAYCLLAKRGHEKKPAGDSTKAEAKKKQAKKPIKKRRAVK